MAAGLRTCEIAEGKDVHSLPIPASLKELVINRWDGLTAGAILTLKCAAIVDGVFSHELLKAIVPRMFH